VPLTGNILDFSPFTRQHREPSILHHSRKSSLESDESDAISLEINKSTNNKLQQHDNTNGQHCGEDNQEASRVKGKAPGRDGKAGREIKV